MESQSVLEEPILHSPELDPSHFEVNSKLEKVLNDTKLGYFRRFKLASWIELKLLFPIAAPAVFVYLINNAMSLSARIFAGQLGNLELAAASLGNSGVQLLAYGLMVIYIHIQIQGVSFSYTLLPVCYFAVRHGKRSGNSVWSSLWSSQV